ncbi:MAG: hypothetical protein ABIP02_01900 [Arenimonas sp.]
MIEKIASVIIKGNTETERGANVEIFGRLEIVNVADDHAIAIAKANLQKAEK